MQLRPPYSHCSTHGIIKLLSFSHELLYLHGMKYIITLLFVGCLAYCANAQTVISAKDAKAHIGETVTITDKVYGGKLLSSNMTLFDIGGRYPNELLTVMIPPADRSKFSGQPEVDWKDKTVTVTGKVIDYRGKPEIVINDPKALTVSGN